MESSPNALITLIAVAVIAVFLCAESPCYGDEAQGQSGGSAYATFLLTAGSRIGVEYRSPAGFGFDVAVGTMVFELIENPGVFPVVCEALAILPLFRVGRSGALDLALGMLTFYYIFAYESGGFMAGAAARLRFELGGRWALLVRAGASYRYWFGPVLPNFTNIRVFPDLGLGVALRLGNRTPRRGTPPSSGAAGDRGTP
jgi:hypothetical protein